MSKSRPHILAHAAEKAGSLAKLAAQLGVTRQAISQWTKIPAERVIDVERVTGIPRKELRPDLYEVA